ncbi:hypothetical protein K3495_g5809 [Podosphaera aphanis]|nr:hypothetical protein K3495_g5809 [Podosphaera aphanis]
MTLITGVHASSWHELLQHWWQINRNSPTEPASQDVKKYFSGVTFELCPYRTEQFLKKPTSFGVYLGEIRSPPSTQQIRILSKWDLLIFDPTQRGTLRAVSSGLYRVSSHTLARLDLKKVTEQSTKTQIIALTDWVAKYFNPSDIRVGHHLCFTGISLSNWSKCCTISFLKEFVYFLGSLGLSVYLETYGPDFLCEPKLAELHAVSGLIIHNGTISQNGKERDAFQMMEMRPTVKAFVSQACLRNFVVLLWETIDDDILLSNGVIKRCYQWSKFYNALPWIGTESATRSTSLSLNQREPLGAFDWLKEKKVSEFHQRWRLNQSILPRYIENENYTQISQALSILSVNRLWDQVKGPIEELEIDRTTSTPATSFIYEPSESRYSSSTSRLGSRTESFSNLSVILLGWLSQLELPESHSISTSPSGVSYKFLACFPLGVDVNENSFTEVVQLQHKLRKMNLLEEIEQSVLYKIGARFQEFLDSENLKYVRNDLQWLSDMQGLVEQLSSSTKEEYRPLSIYIGLDSGFQVQPNSRFWSVYEFDEYGTLNIYISRNIRHNIQGIILHTFLSTRGFSRRKCFQAELAFLEWSETLIKPQTSPKRIREDISLLSPSELLKFFQEISLTRGTNVPVLIDQVKSEIEIQLLDRIDFLQVKKISTNDYLSGQASSKDLIDARIRWYHQAGFQHPDPALALEVFDQIDIAISDILKNRVLFKLKEITNHLTEILKVGKIDARTDLVIFSIFSAMRRLAFDEVYLEVTDRNALFNDQSDQAAAFAELFATGARCEAYFDLSPSAFGKLLSDRYRAYHQKAGHEPPLYTDSELRIQSAYAAAKIDVDLNSKKSNMSAPQRFTFLSVFVIPALVDIILLTTTGRGLYLSGYMSHTEQNSATLALMISLLISGAVGTWITCGGSYYLISMAFSAMNMFVVIRLIGGLAFTLIIAIIGLIALGITDGLIAGVIFFLYLIALTSYLCLLATLANYQYPGSAFQSGRPLIILIVPFLFISPIISIWVPGHDIFIYLAVFYTFLILLVLSVRYSGSRWTTWYIGIRYISDKELRQWYIDRYENGNEKAFVGFTEPGILKIARDAITRDIKAFKKSYRKNCGDTVVKSLAKSFDATVFLLEWYSNYSGTPLPIPFSSTWNIQTKIALQTLRQLQTGIRLHNAFIHWRQAGDEVGCNILYFIVALLDKWNAILSGGKLLGLSTMSTQYRMPVGFALAYYLIGAVLLDFNAAKLHGMTTNSQNIPVEDLSSIPEAVEREVQARRFVYWKMLRRYIFFHVWSLAVSCSLLWVFNSTETSTILFLAYLAAYTGLLWYQYTKIFTGPRSLKPLIIAISLGIPFGQALRYFFPEFIYCDVSALGVATWTAAILSLWFARIRTKKPKFNLKILGNNPEYDRIQGEGIYFAFTDPGKDSYLSQDELRIIFHNLLEIREEERYRIDPEVYPGLEVSSILLRALGEYRNPHEEYSKFALEAFPNALELLASAVIALDSGEIIIDIVPIKAMADHFGHLNAISCIKNEKLRIFIGCEAVNIYEQVPQINNFCQRAAEIILHAVAETIVGMSHEDAILTESLLTCRPMTPQPKYVPVSGQISNYLSSSLYSQNRAESLASFSLNQTLKFLSLGLEPDLDWESLPRDIRELIIKRCVGEEDVLTESQSEWLASNQAHGVPVTIFLARCNFGAYIARSNHRYALSIRDKVADKIVHQEEMLDSSNFLKVRQSTRRFTPQKILQGLKFPFSIIYHNIGICFRLLAIAFVADPELQRELNYALHTSTKIRRRVTLFIITGVWKYTKALQALLVPLFILYSRTNITKLWKHIGGTYVSLKRQILSIENAEGCSTAFISSEMEDGTFEVYMYSGNLDRAPQGNLKLQRISTYNSELLILLRLEEFSSATRVNVYEYEYSNTKKSKRKVSKFNYNRYPIRRKCVEGKNQYEQVNFNSRGLVKSGSYILHGSLIRFNYHYQRGNNYDNELLRAEFALPHLTCTVAWSAPPKNHPEKLHKWIPHSNVTEAAFVLESDVYESHWTYDHKFHPIIHTTLNGEAIETPPIIQWDYLGVLKKPTRYSFHHDDPLISFKSLHSRIFPCLLGLKTHQQRVSTSRARSQLWSTWKNTPGFDGVTMRWLDEKLLRKDQLLQTYWHRRDRGDLTGAEEYLNENYDGVMAVVDLDNSISGWAPLAIKIADLYSFGQGGDANSRTRSNNPDFDNDDLQVLAVDSGTWPNEGGGVSACRRDMINNLRSVNWYMVSECANDFGLPKHQTEMNVRSLKVIPLWGLDFLTPTHGLFKDQLDTEVEHIPRYKTKLDVRLNFLPILTTLVRGARTSNFTPSDFHQITRALVNLNTYFSGEKHWGAIWTSSVVKDAWRNLWISSDLVSPTPSESWFQTEIPTIAQLDSALELWYRYLFIFSIPIPERIPAIFQASHHSVSASYGIVCKMKRNCTLQIWDHAISWREANLYLSSDLCNMAPFIRNTLLGLMRVTSQLTLHHADIILPCADFFNPGWEIEIGTSQGSIEHRNKFKRKIDPIINGITDMTKYVPIEKIKSERPTVTMLSHVWYAKDIKTAILAADIIVNEWGFTDYRLEIYGSIDKAPSYSTDCFEMIASKSLPQFVFMCGESNPTSVLEKTWVFLNSSISEGLPLALGEAALTGAPVVCTDVGASLRVLTDPDTGECYSAVVAPNDPRNLARAQINLLAMLDEWAPYANDAEDSVVPTLQRNPTSLDVQRITARMYEKKEERRALGMKCRQIVQKSFNGERYLREHEQMLWVGKARHDSKSRGTSTQNFPVQKTYLNASPLPSIRRSCYPQSSVQSASMMSSSVDALTLMTSDIRSLFDHHVQISGTQRSSSQASTFFPHHSASLGTDEILASPRPAFWAKNMYSKSPRGSSLRRMELQVEDSNFERNLATYGAQ